jgi:hypothetical protein
VSYRSEKRRNENREEQREEYKTDTFSKFNFVFVHSNRKNGRSQNTREGF